MKTNENKTAQRNGGLASAYERMLQRRGMPELQAAIRGQCLRSGWTRAEDVGAEAALLLRDGHHDRAAKLLEACAELVYPTRGDEAPRAWSDLAERVRQEGGL